MRSFPVTLLLTTFFAASPAIASTAPLKINPGFPTVKDCRGAAAPSVGRGTDGFFRVGFFCGGTDVWTPETGDIWHAFPWRGKITNAHRDFLVADEPWSSGHRFNMLAQTIEPFTMETQVFNIWEGIVFWSDHGSSVAGTWSSTVIQSSIIPMVPYEKVGISFLFSKPGFVTTYVADDHTTEVNTLPAALPVRYPTQFSYAPDIMGDMVALELAGKIMWWQWITPFGTSPTGEVLTSQLCNKYSDPILGGYGGYAEYVIYRGEKCGVDGNSVLYLTDIRDLQNQHVYRIDEVLPPNAPYKAEYDAELDGIAYTSSSGNAIKFIRFSL